MSELRDLQDRLESALGRLERAGRPGGGRVAELEAENAALAAELERLNAARQKDLAELDTLISQIRPLVEEPN